MLLRRLIPDAMFWRVVFCLLIILNLCGLGLDIWHTWQYGGSDLRIRVVGSRVLGAGRDPYSYSWKAGEPEAWLDPTNKPGSTTSRLTVTPLVLVIHHLFDNLGYRLHQWIWFFIQWLLMFLSYWFFSKTTKNHSQLRQLQLVFLVGGASWFWRYHIEIGQIYILYVALGSLVWWLISRESRWGYVLAGLLGVARPSFIVVGLLLVLWRVRYLVWWLVGIVIGLGLPTLLFKSANIWIYYWQAMTRFQGFDMDTFHRKIDFLGYYPWAFDGVDNLHRWLKFESFDTSVKFLLSFFLGIEWGWQVVIMGAVIGLLLTVIFAVKHYQKQIVLGNLITFGFLLMLVAELFLPSPRYSYAQVLWLLPLASILTQHTFTSHLYKPWLALITMGMSLWFLNGWLGEIWLMIVFLTFIGSWVYAQS